MNTVHQNIIHAHHRLKYGAVFEKIQANSTTKIVAGSGSAIKLENVVHPVWQIVLPNNVFIYYTNPTINEILQRLYSQNVLTFVGISMPDLFGSQNQAPSAFYATEISL